MTELDWQRSRRCDGGSCVEVADAGEVIAVRDGKDPEGGMLRLTPDRWAAFLDEIRDGSYRMPPTG